MSTAELKQQIRELSLPDRLELLEELWLEVESAPPPLLDWQKEILDQRLRDAEAHPEDAVSWAEARRRLERPAGES